MISVVSTGKNALTKDLCIESVASQKLPPGVLWRHLYTESSTQNPIKSSQENYRDLILELPDDDICVMLDGDDWLAHEHALANIYELHQLGKWVTWGSFKYADGRPGFTGEYVVGDNVRRADWRASHCKTFRAGLYKHIRQSDFTELAHDMPLMFALIEMAGWDKVAHNEDVCYVYNFKSSFEFNADEAGRAAELVANKRSRDLTSYQVRDSFI